MVGWAWMVLPAMATALVVRGYSRIHKPYFALSQLVAGPATSPEPVVPLPPSALWSRLVWPLVLGFAVAWSPMRLWEVAVCGLLAGILLLWPLVFHGLPWNLPRRRWHLIALYLSFLGSYAALSALGGVLQSLFIYVSAGDSRQWLADKTLGVVLSGVAATIFPPIYKRLSEKVQKDVEVTRADTEAANAYRSRLMHHMNESHIRKLRERVHKLMSGDSLEPWEPIITATLLIETLERPRYFRSVEWLVHAVKLRPRTTCGPLQMKDAPFRLGPAIKRAVQELRSADVTPGPPWDTRQIAKIWHGAASQQPGSSLSYSHALLIALELT